MTLQRKFGLRPESLEKSQELVHDLSEIIRDYHLKLDKLDNLWIGDIWFGNKNLTDRNIMMNTAQTIHNGLRKKYPPKSIPNWYEGGVDFRKYTRFRVQHLNISAEIKFLSNADGCRYLKQLYGWYLDKQYL